MSDWREITLGDFVRVQRGYDLPERERRQGVVPVMGSAGQSGTHDVPLTRGPGIVIGRSGASFGVVSWCGEDFWPLNTTLFVTDFLGNHPRFAYYFLRALDLSGYNVGSAQPSLNRNHIYPIPVTVPDAAEQHRIADLLGALDDKIALNRRMNRTLEATAAALFRSWFVDFDPVVAKGEGRRAVGVPKAVQVALPNGFTDSEVGPIPEGWDVVELGELVRVVKGRSYSRNDLQGDTAALVTLKSVSRGGGFRTDGFKAYSGRYTNEQVLVAGDVVVACTDVTQAGEVIGRPARVIADTEFRTLIASLDLVIVRSRDSSFGNGILYWLMADERFTDHASGFANGTTVLHLDSSAIPTYRFPMPPRELAAAFSELSDSFFAHIVSNHRESRSLAALRDTLLPRLLSGAIRMRDAERVVSAAV